MNLLKAETKQLKKNIAKVSIRIMVANILNNAGKIEFNIHKRFRISQEIQNMINELMQQNKDKWETEGHLLRSAIIMIYKQKT